MLKHKIIRLFFFLNLFLSWQVFNAQHHHTAENEEYIHDKEFRDKYKQKHIKHEK